MIFLLLMLLQYARKRVRLGGHGTEPSALPYTCYSGRTIGTMSLVQFIATLKRGQVWTEEKPKQ